MLVKFGVPKNQKVYRYDYYVKNLLNSHECIISIVHSGRLIYFLLTYNNWYMYKVNSLISAFHKHIMTQSLFHISEVQWAQALDRGP